MSASEIGNVIDGSSRKLLQNAVPPVRYWLLKQVMDKEDRSADVRKAMEGCATYRPKLKLLEKLGPDGTWPIPRNKKLVEDTGPGPPLGWTYRTMLWNLFALSEYNAPRDEGHIEVALKRLFEWQNEDGFIPGPWTDVFPLPYFNGYALYILSRFGLERESGTKRLADWLLTMQRADGGWNLPFCMDVHYLPEYRAMRMREFVEFVRARGWKSFDLKALNQYPSCPYITMVVVWGLSQQEKAARSAEVRRGADFVLDWFFKRTPHPTYYMSEDHWTKLRYPYKFGSGLMALDILTALGYGVDDPRMDRPIKWLLSARASDGLWSQSDRPHPERDQWISLIALRTLKRFVSGQRPGTGE